jgi:hypothetical protein
VYELSLTEYTLEQPTNERILRRTLCLHLLEALPWEINAQDLNNGHACKQEFSEDGQHV